jgi:hypothetical protein
MKDLERRLERSESQATASRPVGPDLPDTDEELAAKILATRVLGEGVWVEFGFEGTLSEAEVIARAGVIAALTERL